jgi:4'-phosphopantetheinyl transferase EntD
MISDILWPGVAAAERYDDNHAGALFPEEERAIRAAAPSRRAEFVSGRICARAAMRKLGLDPAALPQGAGREPVWPPGLVGSITHCRGYRAAAVARSDGYLGVGIDAEPNETLPPGVLNTVASPEERRWLETQDDQAIHWDRVLFSAKESVYKAWFPLARRWLGFEDAVLRIDLKAGRFEARLRAPGPMLNTGALTEISGRICVTNGLVLTAAAIPYR